MRRSKVLVPVAVALGLAATLAAGPAEARPASPARVAPTSGAVGPGGPTLEAVTPASSGGLTQPYCWDPTTHHTGVH